MAVVRQQVTADELLYMPDDGFRYERADGAYSPCERAVRDALRAGAR